MLENDTPRLYLNLDFVLLDTNTIDAEPIPQLDRNLVRA
jgi:hypothetical protein